MKEKLPVLTLRLITIVCAISGILICIFVLPLFVEGFAEDFPDLAVLQYPLFIGLYAAAVNFFVALIFLWLLLNNISRHNKLNEKHLKAIRHRAVTFAVFYAVSFIPVVYLYADADDAPGLILIGAFMIVFPLGVAAATAVLERMMKEGQTNELPEA